MACFNIASPGLLSSCGYFVDLIFSSSPDRVAIMEEKKYPRNNEEYLSRCPAQDGADEYGAEQAKQMTAEEQREAIETLKKIRDLLRRYDPS